MDSLDVLIDSIAYIRDNCYQHQLAATLNCYKTIDVKFVELSSLKYSGIRDDAKVLSCLKLRTLQREVENVKRYVRDKHMFVYEQDPWESFIDGSQHKGAYESINNTFDGNVTFLNTSHTWSKRINDAGMKSKYVDMWMLPYYCQHDPAWKTRPIDIGFCGQLHPYRKKFFDELASYNIIVHHAPSTSYNGYLNTLSSMKIFIHNEKVDWVVNGVQTPANALWIKDIEAAARGCFSMRNIDDEWHLTGLAQNVKTIIPYNDADDAVRLIKEILDPDKDHQQLINDSVKYISTAPGWNSVAKTIFTHNT